MRPSPSFMRPSPSFLRPPPSFMRPSPSFLRRQESRRSPSTCTRINTPTARPSRQAPSHPLPSSVTPAPLDPVIPALASSRHIRASKIRHTRACRGYLAEFCTESRACPSHPRAYLRPTRTRKLCPTHALTSVPPTPPSSVIPAPKLRHTRACRGYLAEFCTEPRACSRHPRAYLCPTHAPKLPSYPRLPRVSRRVLHGAPRLLPPPPRLPPSYPRQARP